MGKKGKKSGGKSGGGKKKGKKGKKAAEPEMTFKEAILAYQINIKEKQLEDVQYEVRALEEKHKRHLERNERLKEEQVFYLKNLLKQSREFEKTLSEAEIIEKEEVIVVMKDKWKVYREEDKNLNQMRGEVAAQDREIADFQKQVNYWNDYKDRGGHEHKKQIQLLEAELHDMQSSYDEMAAHLERTLNIAKDEIMVHTEETLDKQKGIASEKAMKKMDKYSRQEVIDNDWLQREVVIHKRDAQLLMSTVEQLEQENLNIMSELFECTVDDLKISREFFLTQFQDDENLDETGILEMDLSKLSINDQKPEQPWFIEESAEETKKRLQRPKSAIQKAVEKKVFSIPEETYELLDKDEYSDSEYDGRNGDEDSEAGDPFENYYQFEDENFEDYLKLGPLELKLLSVEGRAKPIYKPKTPPPDEIRAKAFKPDQWPVTGSMIHSSLSPRRK